MNLITFYRMQRWLYDRHMKWVARLVEIVSFILFSSHITAKCHIGKGSYFAHRGLDVLIVDGTRIGRDCVIGVGCKFVRKFPYRNVAEVGDHVYFGPGCVVCGPVKIGNNVIIAANAVVLKSIPDGCVVAGMPARIVGRTADLGYDPMKNPQYEEGWAPVMREDAVRTGAGEA